MNFCAANDKNLVVLAGDTHNAWASDLVAQDGSKVGVEFATASVSSPGLEDYLNLDTPEALALGEAGALLFVQGLRYANMSDRGLLVVTFDQTQAVAEWHFVSSIKEPQYSLLDERAKALKTLVGTENRSLKSV